MLFDEATLRKLNQLSLVAARVRRGAIKGERRSARRGSSVEFADYRDYAPGDDLRRLDWNIYARLDRPFIKLFEEEEDLAVHILLDGSRSMDWPPAPDMDWKGADALHKFRYAQRLAAGLGAIALSAGDSLTLGFLQGSRVAASFGPTRGQAGLARLLAFVEKLQPDGQTDLNAAIRQYTLTPRRPGLVILISDLLTESGYESGLRPMLGQGHEAALLHVLAPDELDPAFSGDLQLVDSESGQEQDVSLDGGLRRLYYERAQAWLAQQQAQCRKQGIRYLSLLTNRPWDQAILLELRKVGVVK